MANEFFSRESFEQHSPEEYPIVYRYRHLNYQLLHDDQGLAFTIEIEEQRLNAGEIKALLNYHHSERILSETDASLLYYLLHKLGNIQTRYRIKNDLQFIIDYLQDSKIPLHYDGDKLHISQESLSLHFNFYFDEKSNVMIEYQPKPLILKGMDRLFAIHERILYQLPATVPLHFYEELFQGKKKITIDDFLAFREELLPILEQHHHVEYAPSVKELNDLPVSEKVAPVVLEIGKTRHLITFELKYQIGDELFPVNTYSGNGPTQPKHIKITREDNQLVRYHPDSSLTGETLALLFEQSGVSRNKSSNTNPFLATLTLSALKTVHEQIIPRAKEHFPLVYQEGVDLTLHELPVEFSVDTNFSGDLNLFEFSVRFSIGGHLFSLEDLKQFLNAPQNFLTLPDGRVVTLENVRELSRWIEFLNRYQFKRKQGKYQGDTKTALELDEFLKHIRNKEFRSNEEYRQLLSELKERKPVETVPFPNSVSDILRDYQKEGVYWLYFLQKYRFGGILADEMGLGKTLQALTELRMFPDRTHLVIAPKSLIYNWESEIRNYFPETKVLLIDTNTERRQELIAKANRYDIVITSYSLLQRDYQSYMDLEDVFDHLILDEAHYVKNIKTVTAKTVRLIPCRQRLLLTGTPLENNLDELYGAFDLIMPGYLGTKQEFSRQFISKIERNHQTTLELLQAKIRPFILRRTKREVLKELPEKQEQVVFNEMTNKQVALYHEVLQRVKEDINTAVSEQGYERARMQVLSALLKLRQICNHPGLIDSSFQGEPDISGKYEQFLELLEEVLESGGKVLVFSQFTSMLDQLETPLQEDEIKYLRLDGKTKNRQELVEQFNKDDDVRVFLISLKAGGVGLNLTGANTVFLYDPWWNPMAEQQAIDRAHRIGQEQTVNIYKFITKNSIEEKILQLQQRKSHLFENLVSEDEGFVNKLEWEDLMELFE